ncbi:MAG: FAD-dependent oxidoreductase [Acidobacteria bacterium]|nr:FAD-dependent oxidoreductase [Acidobacteriota bacterium]
MAWKLPHERLEKKFEDKKPLYTKAEALVEAHRCLFCHDAPCIKSCATAIDIPGFIKQIAHGNMRGAAHTILSANMLGASCAQVCPVEVMCAGSCVLNDLNETPIAIGRLQRYATTEGLRDEVQSQRKLFTPRPAVGKKVALIGSGPASLACAGYLALAGVKAVVFERDELPGGLNTTGVAPYKLVSDDALREVGWILSHGVELKCGVALGKDITVDQLLDDYDAVFLGLGLGRDRSLGIPGEDADGVWGATFLIRAIKHHASFTIGEHVRQIAVVGAGNTAIDIARELAELTAAEVIMVYRRSRGHMSGYAHEMKQATQSGVRFMENARPVAIESADGQVTGLRVAVPEGSYTVPCQWVVQAVGQERIAATMDLGVAFDSHGRIVADEHRRTSHPRVYAGGDCVNGGREVVNAAADGRIAAYAMLASWGLDY